ncbi:hypothetical protein [Flavobacterium flavipallidum]|uniref:Lipocalin-like domain-containing protein n=1 Tax=Flavobacterium flavipallidum TaxID=3139140 RepID=A0ABU9HM07_9FLAO
MLLSVAFMNLSCSNDDEPTNSIVGTWERSKTGYIDSNNEPYDVKDYEHGCTTNKDNWTFTENGNYTITEYYNCDSEPYTENFNYTLTDKILSYTSQSNEVVTMNNSFTIISLTATHLKVKQTNNKLSKSTKDSSNRYYEFVRK